MMFVDIVDIGIHILRLAKLHLLKKKIERERVSEEGENNCR